MLKAGMPVKAKPTITNRNCGIQPDARGWITCVTAFDVSFTVEAGSSQMIEATASKEVFGANFIPDDFSRPFNPAYVAPSPFIARYPDRFL